jgi:hypothetical protein
MSEIKDEVIKDFEEPEENEEPTEGEFELDNLHKNQNKFSLEVRRAIEDHLEELRLRREVDYLYDDEFGTDTAEEDKE